MSRVYDSVCNSPLRVLSAGFVTLCTLLTSLGCSPSHYEKSADKETGGILGAKAGAVPNVDPEFSIEPPDAPSLTGLEQYDESAEYLGDAAESERGARVLSLADALDLAIHHNRSYLNQKETIYLQALDLTLIRHELEPIFTGSGELVREREGSRSVGGSSDIESLARAVERGVSSTVVENTFAKSSNLGFSMLQKTGARLAADFTTDFLSFLGGDRAINRSRLAFRLTQPLLKGGGYLTTLENLTQAERNLLYEMREFANFRREFIVDTTSQYYEILRARDQVRNNWIGYQGFSQSVIRGEALVDEGKQTRTELGQLQQAALRAESDWVNAVRDYQQLLDEFKIQLGLPIESQVVMLEDELRQLTILSPKVSREQAVEVAVVTRPDLVTADDQVVDAERQIEVAKVDLKPGLDVVAAYDVPGGPTDSNPSLQASRRNWSAGLVVDLPFDRKAERNTYRSSLIALERATRDRELAIDTVRLEIYNDWRTLEQAKKNYEIAELGVSLAEQRLEEQVIRNEIGEGEARDLIDAQRDLTDSLNQRTSAIVDHTLARLRLWQDMGILFINEDGSWVTRINQEDEP